MMPRVFIGFDRRESIAAYVLAHSIARHSSVPVQFTFLRREQFESFYHRPRGPLDSTDFSLTRFLIPALCDFEGWALFMDCDMLARSDIAHLWALRDARFSVRVVKHEYVPARERKFLDQQQTAYTRKNWSSVMLFNCARCRVLSPGFVEQASGLDLQQLRWAQDEQIGSLPKEWNHLVGEENQCPPEEARLLHYTNGTPCFDEFADSPYADEWHAARADMEHCG